jgi:hypothetical protein
MTRDRAIAEYQYCARIAQELGIPKSSFVFPRNSVAYLAELRDAGFTCFRDVDRLPARFSNGTLNSLAMIWADFAGSAPYMVEPSLKEGIVSIPGSLLIRYAAGWRKFIPDSSRLRRLRKGLERARLSRGVFHVWFHPENLYAGWPRVENVVAHFLEELGVLVRNGDVRCLTMGQLAAEFRSNLAVKQSSRSSQACTPAGQLHSPASGDPYTIGPANSVQPVPVKASTAPATDPQATNRALESV